MIPLIFFSHILSLSLPIITLYYFKKLC